MLFPGRFQPFHRGHLETVKSILKDCKSVVIGLREQGDDIFTTQQRKEIIALATTNMPVLVVPLDQVEYYDYVYSSNTKIISQFPAEKTKFIHRSGNISGSEVRQLLKYGLDISHLVCDGTEDLIKEFYNAWSNS